MADLGLALPHGVYRTPGRTAEVLQQRPSRRTLLAPLGHAAGVTILFTLLVVGMNGLGAMLLPSDTRFIPMVEQAEDAVAVALLVSPVVLAVLIRRRVAPLWSAFRLRARIGYVAALLLIQLVVLAAAEAAIFTSGGGLRLFEPVHKSSVIGPDGRTAHVYAGGLLGCTHDVYISGPLSPTMTHAFRLSRNRCITHTHVRWNEDRSVQLLDEDGNVLGSEPSGFHLFGAWN